MLRIELLKQILDRNLIILYIPLQLLNHPFGFHLIQNLIILQISEITIKNHNLEFLYGHFPALVQIEQIKQFLEILLAKILLELAQKLFKFAEIEVLDVVVVVDRFEDFQDVDLFFEIFVLDFYYVVLEFLVQVAQAGLDIDTSIVYISIFIFLTINTIIKYSLSTVKNKKINKSNFNHKIKNNFLNK